MSHVLDGDSRESLADRKRTATRRRIAAAAAHDGGQSRSGGDDGRAHRGCGRRQPSNFLPVLQLQGRRRCRGHERALAQPDHRGPGSPAGRTDCHPGRRRRLQPARLRIHRDRGPGPRIGHAHQVIRDARRVDAAHLRAVRRGDRRTHRAADTRARRPRSQTSPDRSVGDGHGAHRAGRLARHGGSLPDRIRQGLAAITVA